MLYSLPLNIAVRKFAQSSSVHDCIDIEPNNKPDTAAILIKFLFFIVLSFYIETINFNFLQQGVVRGIDPALRQLHPCNIGLLGKGIANELQVTL